MRIEAESKPLIAGKPEGAAGKLRVFLEAIKFEHTIFALPFAYLGMVLAARATAWLAWAGQADLDHPGDGRRAHAGDDAQPADRRPHATRSIRAPPTARCRKSGSQPGEMVVFAVVSGAVLAFSAWQLNPLCFALTPVALLFLVGYSYTKRFTWLCHLALGLTDGIAPIGGWLAVNPTISVANLLPPLLLGLAVAAWVGGFDLIYACQDIAFDRAHRLYSIPARFGPARALQISEMAHGASVGLLAAVGAHAGLGVAVLDRRRRGGMAADLGAPPGAARTTSRSSTWRSST